MQIYVDPWQFYVSDNFYSYKIICPHNKLGSLKFFVPYTIVKVLLQLPLKSLHHHMVFHQNNTH
jgi:hypothetical protein